ncbi:STAS domain-containing protein [Clostridiisalibacter paucivorans]|uniref:STAS domain-containing protein n=1 Tax=Clostridiisalibacter paucivorans TaxID=408753 RepID=UPI00047C9B2E|nr:STAS domain-containing protein [Clostridiisalibacter paucivorans]
MALTVDKKYDENKNMWILKPVGEIDIYTAPEFKDILLDIIKEKTISIVIDGERLEYIDSTGLGVLISGLKKLKEKDENIIIKNMKANIKKLFSITGLNNVFIIKE